MVDLIIKLFNAMSLVVSRYNLIDLYKLNGNVCVPWDMLKND